MSRIPIAGVQMEPKIGELDANRSTIVKHLQSAAARGAKLIVFPECAVTGYGFASRVEALAHAETIDGPSYQTLFAQCSKLGVFTIYGFLERDEDRLFNALAFVGPEGLVGSYRKVHLPYIGVDRFADLGDRPFAVQEITIDDQSLRVGMHICYDGGFPESGRVLTLLGADLLVLPTNWPTHAECAAEHMIATRAMENVVYCMAVNRIGEERGFRFIGHSSIADPTGNIMVQLGPEKVATFHVAIDPTLARTKRLIRVAGLHEVDRIRDRRPEFYGEITRSDNDRNRTSS